MNSKSILFVYYREKIFYLLFESKKKSEGIFLSEANIEDFLKTRKPGSVFLVFSKPKIFTRKIFFPFSSVSKISLILENEISDFFPVPLSELNIYWYPSDRKKDTCEVTIWAIDKKTINSWQSLQKKYSFKLQTSFEGFVLSNLIKKHSALKNCSIIFIDFGYIVLHRIQNGIITNLISSFFENDESLKSFSHYISEIPEKEKVYVVGNHDKSSLLGLTTFQSISAPAFSNNTLLFNVLEPLSVNPAFKVWQLKKRYYVHNSYFIFGMLYLVVMFLLISPAFTARTYEEKVKKIDMQMDDIFKQEFPDVKRIVDPVVQAEEKVKGFRNRGIDIIPVSPLNVMSKIVQVVPGTMDFTVSRISLSGSQVFLSCETDSLQSLDKIITIFKKNRFFSNVEQGNISLSGGKVNFNIILTIAQYKK
ncbi:MAG: hypothetical protein M1135_02025 [Candidatus Omnitrophica bacterium]|nr:hypothetical protein [Candidatus Omnitrophota bacterium]